MQSVPITTKVVSSNPAYGEVYSIQHYVIKFVADFSGLLHVHRFPSSITSITQHMVLLCLLWQFNVNMVFLIIGLWIDILEYVKNRDIYEYGMLSMWFGGCLAEA
jgi:hypothetical protein